MADASLRSARAGVVGGCQEIAAGVFCLEAGKGLMRSNVFFVKATPSWVLIDAGSANCLHLIQEPAESLFGTNAPPAAILLTHTHPDHTGCVRELARVWHCPVYAHHDEMPIAAHADLATIQKYASPLDRWIILPLLRMMPRKRAEAMIAKSSLNGVVQELDPASVPGLSDWRCVPAPGHTPGQVAFFRPSDRALITGDALLTVNLNSFGGILLWLLRQKEQRVSGAPWYSSWNWPLAKLAVVAFAELQPRVLAPGHGTPMDGERAVRQLRALAERYDAQHRSR